MSHTANDLRSTTGKVVKEGSLKPKNIDKLDAQQRAWSDKVIRALGLSSAGSQGRLIAQAVASAEEIDANGTDQDKATAQTLRSKVLAAGTPPWKDTRKALAAGSAKAHLDILSIPAGQRQLQRFGGPQTENDTFVIRRTDASGADQEGFLCKPASAATGDHLAASGGPKGGEVAREALSSRAAQLLNTQTGIDIGMPETHVVQLDASLVPGQAQGMTSVTCSVQEFRPAVGSMLGATSQRKRAAKPEQVAALAIFDTLTLNTDRHGGNILVDAGGNLIPIDQGESFAENNEGGIGRLKASIGGPHNALLGLPGAHEPFSPAMLKKLKALSADKYASGLKSDQAEIGRANPDMDGAVSPGAIENARRAAAFVKLAASNKPPLNPAAIQTVLGSGAEQLFAPTTSDKEFQALAKRLIGRMAPAQAALKEVQLSSDFEYGSLAAKLNDLGWSLAARGGAPDPYAITDPLVALSIVSGNIQRPARAQVAKVLSDLGEGKGQAVSPDNALATVATFRAGVVASLIPLAQPASAAKLQNGLGLASRMPIKQRLDGLTLLLATVEAEAKVVQAARLAAFNTANRPAEIQARGIPVSNQVMVRWNGVGPLLQNGALIEFDQTMTTLQADAANGEFLPAAAGAVGKRLRALADVLMIRTDPDLTAGFQAVTADDPFTALDRLDALSARSKTGTMANAALDQMQSEFDTLLTRYQVAATSQDATRVTDAIAARDVKSAATWMAALKMKLASWQVLPTKDEFTKSVSSWNIPANDPDLLATVAAIDAGDRAAFEASSRELSRNREGNQYGDGALRQLQSDLQALLQKHTIPAQHTDLVDFQNNMALPGKPIDARFALERLETLADAGAFS